MPLSNPERWISVPIIAGMLGIFWRGVSLKVEKIDNALAHYVTESRCRDKQELNSLRLEQTIQREIRGLKDDIFEHMRKLETAILKQTGVDVRPKDGDKK